MSIEIESLLKAILFQVKVTDDVRAIRHAIGVMCSDDVKNAVEAELKSIREEEEKERGNN